MNLWGATPLIAAALLSGSTGVHTTAAHHAGAVTPAPAAPSLTFPGAGAPIPVLQQVGPARWETTVLLNDTGPACDQAAAHYWLATTTPYRVIPGTPMRQKPIMKTDPATGTPPYGSSCQVTVAFAKLGQVPETATLVLDQPGTSSAVALTVSRNVNLTDYLGIPAITGSVITILSLLLSALLVWRYDRKRNKDYPGIRDWLERPVLGSGAWTANDSWATNISAGLVVVAAVLGAATATSSLFPGIALDRFSIVNIAAGFFVVAAPVVFGIFYSQFTVRNPGLMADATVRLPDLRAATISVPSGASITMAADTTIQDGSARWAIVRSGGTYQIPPGAEIQVLAGIQAVAHACIQAAEPAVANVLAQAIAQAGVEAAAQASVDVDAPAVEQVVEQAVARAGVYPPAGPLAHEFEQMIENAVEDAIHHPTAWFAFVNETITQAGVMDRAITGVFAVDEADVRAAVQAGIRAARQASAAGAAQANIAGVQAGIQALKLAIGQAVAHAVTQPGILDGEQPADAIRQAVTAAVAQEGVRTAAQKVVQDAADVPGRPVPPGIVAAGRQAITQALAQAVPQIGTLAIHGTMAYSGGADIGVLPGSTLQITAPAGTWTIQASDVLAQPPSPPLPVPPGLPLPPPGVQLVQLVPPTAPATPDAPLAQPVLIDATGGAKVTVTGTADISLRKGAVISAPRRPYYRLPRNRQLLAPQGTNVIVANLKMILIANIFTMFGIGAELGIAGVLAGFSDATGHGRGFIFLGLAAVAVLVIIYAATATRAVADPQPGSSISSQAGASFTL
jgi:hypothetical protein